MVPTHTSYRAPPEAARVCALCAEPIDANERFVEVERRSFGGVALPCHPECAEADLGY